MEVEQVVRGDSGLQRSGLRAANVYLLVPPRPRVRALARRLHLAERLRSLSVTHLRRQPARAPALICTLLGAQKMAAVSQLALWVWIR